jgi:hypothetical protein
MCTSRRVFAQVLKTCNLGNETGGDGATMRSRRKVKVRSGDGSKAGIRER